MQNRHVYFDIRNGVNINLLIASDHLSLLLPLLHSKYNAKIERAKGP